MPSVKKRILLALDFTGANFPSAAYTLQQWAQYVKSSQSYEIVIGLSVSNPRSYTLSGCGYLTTRNAVLTIKEYCQNFPVVCWDRDVDEIADDILRRKKFFSKPFYSDFNYGSIVNKCLLLANEMSCSYLVRIDPGTRPPEKHTFDSILKDHVSLLENQNHVVVSRGYKGRIALRDIFLKPEKSRDQCNLVQEIIKIDPMAQVTGGAMFTSRVPGTPAIPFDKSEKGLTLVWASDDGFYQLLSELPNQDLRLNQKSEKLDDIEVPRFDVVGKPKSTIEYYRGVTGMVFLSRFLFLSGKNETEDQASTRAKEDVDQFLVVLKAILLDKEKCRQNDAKKTVNDWENSFIRGNVAPDEFLAQIEKGYQNYRLLRAEWSTVCEALQGELFSFIQVI